MAPTRDVLQALWAQRAQALERFGEWQQRHTPDYGSPENALAIATGLYDLLPPASRARPIAVEGIIELHRRLALVSRA